jgi:hypothetical protein
VCCKDTVEGFQVPGLNVKLEDPPVGCQRVFILYTRNYHPIFVSFQVLTAANMKVAVFWAIVPCRLVEVYKLSQVFAASIIRPTSPVCPDDAIIMHL